MFTPIGNSQVLAVGEIESSALLTAGTHVRVVCVQDRTDWETWRVGFGSSAADAPRYVPGTIEEPLVLTKAPGATQITLRGITPNETVLITCGDWNIDQPFDPIPPTIEQPLTNLPVTVALPVGTKRVRLATDMNRSAGKLFIKFGTSGVVCSRATGMPIKEPSFSTPLVVGVPDGATHLSIMSATDVGNTMWIDSGLATAVGTGADGAPGAPGLGDMRLIQTITASTINTDIALPAGYKGIRVVGKGLTVSVSGVSLTAQFGQAGVFASSFGSYKYNVTYSSEFTSEAMGADTGTEGSHMVLLMIASVGTGFGIGNAAGRFVDVDLDVWRHTETGVRKSISARSSHLTGVGDHYHSIADGVLMDNSNPIDTLRLSVTSGVLSGPLYVYGYL